jgi:aspartate aminotransferase
MKLSADMEKENSATAPILHLEVGQPYFRTPDHIIESAIGALKAKKTAYISGAGMFDLREAVAHYYRLQGIGACAEHVIITTGAVTSLFSLLSCVVDVDDECLVPIPGFPNYTQALTLIGGKPVPYLCRAANNYLPDISELEMLITAKTKCIIICNPGNPTGATIPKDLLGKILDMAQRRGLFTVSDGKLAWIFWIVIVDLID